jgi:hypothetical protein
MSDPELVGLGQQAQVRMAPVALPLMCRWLQTQQRQIFYFFKLVGAEALYDLAELAGLLGLHPKQWLA